MVPACQGGRFRVEGGGEGEGSGAPVDRGVGVEKHPVLPGKGHGEVEVRAGHGGQVRHHDKGILPPGGPPEKGEDDPVAVVAVEPLEALGTEVQMVEGRPFPVVSVQVVDEAVHPGMLRFLQEPPGEGPLRIPLLLLRQLPTHEEELLSGMRPLQGQEGAEIREALRPAPRHLSQEGALSVDHLVVGEGENKPFGECVEEGEGEAVVTPGAEEGVGSHGLQGVVHPPHVPLLREPQPPPVQTMGDPGPGGGLFGDHEGAGGGFAHRCVQLLEKGHGLQVLAPAMHIRGPLPLAARVVPVEHGGHGIDPEAVQPVVLEPVEGAGNEKGAHRRPGKVEGEGSPVRVSLLEGVRGLVEGGAVEPGQPMGILGKVPRHPVQDHPQPFLVGPVHEGPEVGRGAVSGGGSEEAHGLVPPALVQRMLEHRKELHMGEAQRLHVGEEGVGELGIGEPVAFLLPP